MLTPLIDQYNMTVYQLKSLVKKLTQEGIEETILFSNIYSQSSSIKNVQKNKNKGIVKRLFETLRLLIFKLKNR